MNGRTVILRKEAWAALFQYVTSPFQMVPGPTPEPTHVMDPLESGGPKSHGVLSSVADPLVKGQKEKIDQAAPAFPHEWHDR